MAQNFYERLNNYYSKVAEVLKGQAEIAAVFPNPSDIGDSREDIYIEFLKQHLPTKCNIFKGGFIFDEDGNESTQMDILVTTDTTPRFDFFNENNNGKSFSPVEGTLAAFSIKSKLTGKKLFEALDEISSIPPTRSLKGKVEPNFNIKNYDNWPLKVIYASDGNSGKNILQNLKKYYEANQNIPPSRLPDIIHVVGKYILIKGYEGLIFDDKVSGKSLSLDKNTLYLQEGNHDLYGLMFTINLLQQKAIASSKILFSYNWLINKIQAINKEEIA